MIDLAKLRKIHAMTTSPNQHEAAVAWGKVDAILTHAGKGRADLQALLSAHEVRPRLPAGMHGFRPDPNRAFDVDATVRAAYAQMRQRRPEDHPDGRIGFLFANKHRLSAAELQSLTTLAKKHRHLSRKEAAVAAYLVERVKRRRDGKEGVHG